MSRILLGVVIQAPTSMLASEATGTTIPAPSRATLTGLAQITLWWTEAVPTLI